MNRQQAKAIRDRMNAARISQSELARQIGVTQTYISAVLHGRALGQYGAWGNPPIRVRIEEKLGQIEAQQAQKAESA